MGVCELLDTFRMFWVLLMKNSIFCSIELKFQFLYSHVNSRDFNILWHLLALFRNWRAGEQLVGIEQDPSNFTPSNTRFQRGSSSIRRRFSTISTPQPSAGFSQPPATPLPQEEDEVIDGDLYLLAKSYFDCREYRRASHVLRDQMSNKSLFLRCYALYLVLCSIQCFVTVPCRLLIL